MAALVPHISRQTQTNKSPAMKATKLDAKLFAVFFIWDQRNTFVPARLHSPVSHTMFLCFCVVFVLKEWNGKVSPQFQNCGILIAAKSHLNFFRSRTRSVTVAATSIIGQLCKILVAQKPKNETDFCCKNLSSCCSAHCRAFLSSQSQSFWVQYVVKLGAEIWQQEYKSGSPNLWCIIPGGYVAPRGNLQRAPPIVRCSIIYHKRTGKKWSLLPYARWE